MIPGPVREPTQNFVLDGLGQVKRTFVLVQLYADHVRIYVIGRELAHTRFYFIKWFAHRLQITSAKIPTWGKSDC